MIQIHRAVCALLFFVILCAGCASQVKKADGGHSAVSARPNNSASAPGSLTTVNSVLVVLPQAPFSELGPIVEAVAPAELAFDLKFGKSCGEARKLSADSCLIVDISRYSDRDGTPIASGQGADVAFGVHVARASDRHILWRDSYAFTDTALSEDVLQFGQNVQEKGGAGFSSARAAFERGFRQTLRKLNDDRTRQFLK